jgi:hypothetical protein
MILLVLSRTKGVVAHEGLVEPVHDVPRALLVAADDDAVGLHEVVDRRAFFQELGVADDRDRLVGFGGRGGLHLGRGADRHGGLVHDDLGAVGGLADLGGHRQHVLQVRAAVLAGGRAHRDEHDLAGLHGLGRVGGEGEALLLHVVLDHLLQARLVDRDLAALEGLDLGFVVVDADDVVAAFGEAGSGDQTDVAGADDSDAHGEILRG